MSRHGIEWSRAEFVVALAALLLVLPAATRAQDFSDNVFSFQGCASVSGGQLVLENCFDCYQTAAIARMATPQPGTFLFDLHFEVVGTPLSQLYINTGLIDVQFVTYPYCQPGPCAGDITDIAIDAKAGDAVTFNLIYDQVDCGFNHGLRCTFSNLRFYPAVGVSPLGGALDATTRVVHDPGLQDIWSGINRVAELGDVDGDGHADFAYSAALAGPTQNGIVRVLSGQSGAILHEMQGVQTGARLGESALGNAGDIDGDGVDDLVISELAHLRVVSGATGADLYQIPAPEPAQAAALNADGAGDVDGDGRGDIIVSLPAFNSSVTAAGKIFVYSGATLALLYSDVGATTNDRLGYVVSGAGDVDGDGFDDDLATGLAYPTLKGFVRVYSGRTGAVLYTFVGDSPGDGLFVAHAAGDVDGDGFGDIVAGAQQSQVGSLFPPGYARAFSGATGAVLFTVAGTSESEEFGFDVAGAGDLNGDGFDDVFVAASENLGHGRVTAYAGPSGAKLYDVRSLDYNWLGRAIAAGHDLDADGTPDLTVAARTLVFEPRVLTYSGRAALHGAPLFSAFGSLLPGSTLALKLRGGPPGGNAAIVAGLGAHQLPFKGGFLLPTVTTILIGVPLRPDGGFDIATPWPPSLTAPIAVVLQAWCPHPAAGQGLVASNALQLAPP